MAIEINECPHCGNDGSEGLFQVTSLCGDPHFLRCGKCNHRGILPKDILRKIREDKKTPEQKLSEWIAEHVMGWQGAYLKSRIHSGDVDFCNEIKMAMAAAEKALLDCVLHFPGIHNDKYYVSDQGTGDWGQTEYNEITGHEKAGVALCLAIYKLKTGEDWKE